MALLYWKLQRGDFYSQPFLPCIGNKNRFRKDIQLRSNNSPLRFLSKQYTQFIKQLYLSFLCSLSKLHREMSVVQCSYLVHITQYSQQKLASSTTVFFCLETANCFCIFPKNNIGRYTKSVLYAHALHTV